ncbi:MAG: amidophosphoribosyltransferase, partial [Deltaproteobacteria bacterium]|nr:amidophosphoribosyltransferase [Deltaproteobacteria bacterium]
MCGVVGIIGSSEAAQEAFLGLTTLQHRGQDAAGILTHDSDGFHRVKNLGLVESVFTRENMKTLTGNIAIGHTRYSTVGRGDIMDVQPFLLNYPFGLGMVHNGNIINCEELTHELKVKLHRHLLTHSDTEIILNLFAENLAEFAQKNNKLDFEMICQATDKVFQKISGSYSIVGLVAEQGLWAFRDPHSIRPLILGIRKGKRFGESDNISYMISSESVSLSFLGYEIVRDIMPGEVIFIDEELNVYSKVLNANAPPRPCMFEWVYFASPESIIDGVPVYGARIQLGQNLANIVKKKIESNEIQADMIVPVPETSRIAAIRLSEELKIPYREVLIKNRYIKRTFILDSHEKRQSAVKLKLSPVRSEIEGKNVLLVDDSIVRGTTSKKIIELVRAAGAKKVYFLSTCPPIQHPCFY